VTGESRNEVMARAIRRIGVLEQILLLMAALGALAAGALVAWLLGQAFGWAFRPTWAVSALLLFILPAGISQWRVRRANRSGADHEGASDSESETPDREQS
jgi:uncharacterized membrane protein YqjE